MPQIDKNLKDISPERIRVICEFCRGNTNPSCMICKGMRFYFWDPSTRYCYSCTGKQLVFSKEGGKIPLVRNGHSPRDHLDTAQMLRRIEAWVAESPLRKWRLKLDEHGWDSCLWYNRYQGKYFEISNVNLNTCIDCTYSELIKYCNK